MNVGILTHPQHRNYGGILQCYALSTFLVKRGHTPIVISRTNDNPFFLKRWILTILSALHIPRYYHPETTDRTVRMRPFAEKYLKRTDTICSQRAMKKVCRKYGMNVVIVGSDQVWRADFALSYGYNYFLDFVPNGIKKIAYAASFGLSEWQYTGEQTERIKDLLKDFRAVSVREEDAVGLCRANLNVDVCQVLDPTLLLNAEDYDTVCSNRLIDDPYVFVYWLGDKNEMNKLISPYIQIQMKVVVINLRDDVEQVSIEDWLSYIKYANCVLTDSFHGCIFSLIYHRPFKVFENDLGGNGRTQSLLSQLGADCNDSLTLSDQCFSEIQNKINGLRDKSMSFIDYSLR